MEEKDSHNLLYYGILAGFAGAIVQNIFTRPLVWFNIIDFGVFEHAN